MTTPSTSSVFVALGYQVLNLEHGVYVLQSGDDESRIVALLLAAQDQVTHSMPAKLFLEPVPDGVAAVDVVGVWQNLDARRFEESGLVAVALELGSLLPESVNHVSFARPDGGVRQAVVLTSGDVVCFS